MGKGDLPDIYMPVPKRNLPDIYVQAQGRRHIYQANPSCPCYK